MTGLLLLCLLLTAIVFLLCIKLLSMQRAAEEISRQFSDKLETDTNTLISVSTKDKTLCRLADRLNLQLKELQKQKQRFLQGDRELKNAVTNISHDLRTPLTAISGYLDLLDKTEKNEAVNRYLGIIRNRTEALAQLTEELFRYSVITSPEYDTVTEPVNVNALLEESIAEFYAAFQARSITPDIHIAEERVVRNLNPASLSRVFSNLLANALKYSDGDLEITLTAEGQLLFSNAASDLSSVEVGQLFDRFYTVENARKSTGLGLSIAKALMEQMGGVITAGYEKGRVEIELQLPM